MSSENIPGRKSIYEDVGELMELPQSRKESPEVTKTRKRVKNFQTVSPVEDDDMVRMNVKCKESAKKKKIIATSEADKEFTRKIFELVGQQLEARTICNENVINDLEKVTTQMEADYNALKENENKLEHLTAAYMKCIQQATTACKYKLKSLNKIRSDFMQQSEKLTSEHRAETEKVVEEIKSDIQKQQDKLVAETKKQNWESLRRSVNNAMQNNLTH